MFSYLFAVFFVFFLSLSCLAFKHPAFRVGRTMTTLWSKRYIVLFFNNYVKLFRQPNDWREAICFTGRAWHPTSDGQATPRKSI